MDYKTLLLSWKCPRLTYRCDAIVTKFHQAFFFFLIEFDQLILKFMWKCREFRVAYQAPQSMQFSRQEYWSGLPFPSPGDLPDPGIEPWSPALQADALLSEPPGKPRG